jgi:hypothetical protein
MDIRYIQEFSKERRAVLGRASRLAATAVRRRIAEHLATSSSGHDAAGRRKGSTTKELSIGRPA